MEKIKPQEEKFYNKFRLEENSCLGVISPQMTEALLLFVCFTFCTRGIKIQAQES